MKIHLVPTKEMEGTIEYSMALMEFRPNLGSIAFGGSMSAVTAPQLHISFELAEQLVLQLRAAAKETGRASLLDGARILQAEIDAQVSKVQPEH
jgi:hypothetical protein